jgi:murein DD-endopeptidase MepM/ murein hydrolase activator NlpD
MAQRYSIRPLRLQIIVIAAGFASACSGAAAPRPTIGRDIALVIDAPVIKAARVSAGATLASLLRAEGVAAGDAADLVARAGAIFDLRKIRARQPYWLQKSASGAIARFDYEIDGDRLLQVHRDADHGLIATVQPIPKTRRVEIVRGTIDRGTSSLVAALGAAGETIDLALEIADVFGGEIDFNIDVQPGDRFEVAIEKQFRDDGLFAGYGPIVAAEFDNAGRRVRAVHFAPEGGAAAYFDERGVSMRRFLLASPLKFQPVVTSGFSVSRMHPVLHEVRAHLGVDYRAPTGAPVVAVSDGVVVSAGMSGGSGRMVHLRHPNGFETQYLHLSSIAVHAGDRVRQGELIGRVGSSGLATGPHLDYRLKRNGMYVNPVTAHRAMPPADPVPPAQMVDFLAARDRALSMLGVADAAHVSNPNSSH